MLRPSPVRTVVSSLTAQRKFKTDAAEQFADASTQAQAPWQGCNASHLVEEDGACELINLGVFAEKFEPVDMASWHTRRKVVRYFKLFDSKFFI